MARPSHPPRLNYSDLCMSPTQTLISPSSGVPCYHKRGSDYRVLCGITITSDFDSGRKCLGVCPYETNRAGGGEVPLVQRGRPTLPTGDQANTHSLSAKETNVKARTSSVVQLSEFLATDPEVRVLFPALPDFLRSSGSGTGSTQPREYN
jgi:hypothetical protein